MNIVVTVGLCLHTLLGSILYSMDLIALGQLQAVQDEALEIDLCDKFIQALEPHNLASSTVSTPERLIQNPAQLLAHVFITKGLTQAMGTDESVPSEVSPLISCSSATATQAYGTTTLEQVVKTSNERLATLRKIMPKRTLGRILYLYEGVFNRLASQKPTLYSAALCWSVSNPELTHNAVRCFDEYCYQEGKFLWEGYEKNKNSCCCTIL